MQYRLGRQKRKHDTRIPRASTIAPHPVIIPDALDNSKGMPDDLGMMLNDSLGDCTCAAFFHARQIWSFCASGFMLTEPDKDVLALYEAACGYNPADPATDHGGVEQDVLSYLMNTGTATEEGPDKIAGYVEIDQKKLDDLKRTICECGVAYIGIQVPQSIMDNAGDISVPWDVTGDQTIVGGHAVVLVGYDTTSFTCISWGKRYKVTNAFLYQHLDEAYGIIDAEWVMATGNTPFGLTLIDTRNAMGAMKYDT